MKSKFLSIGAYSTRNLKNIFKAIISIKNNNIEAWENFA